jgi:carbon-monoxide dehydrogenase iron sulfur subunit
LKTNKYVNVDTERCIGCGICELACSFEKTKNNGFNPLRSRIRLLRLNPTFNIALTCRLCEDAPCVAACPRNALMQSEKDGVIILNENRCDGCGWCIEACDFGSITLDPEKRVVMICNLCEGRNGIGVYPGRKIVPQACIEWCPEEALELVTRNRIAQKNRESIAGNLYNIKQKS